MTRPLWFVALILLTTHIPMPTLIGEGEDACSRGKVEPSLPPASSLEGGAMERADPEVSGEGPHSRSVAWEMLAPSSYTIDRVVISAGRANLSQVLESVGESWSQRARLGDGAEREAFSAAWDDANNQMIIHGGYYFVSGMQDASWFQPLYTYSPVSNTWTNRGNAKLPAGNVGVWDGADGCFITHGGYYLSMWGNAYYNQTWAWYPSIQGWSRLADGPTRFHHSAVWDPVDGVMIIFGGLDTISGAPYGDLWAFNMSTNSWAQLNPGGVTPSARAYHTAVWDTNGSRMLVFGGYNNGPLSDLWAFNYTQMRWTQLASASSARYGHSACWNSDLGVMTVIGGKVGAQGTNSNETLTYDPSANAWASNANFPAAGRFRHACVYDTANHQVILYGGGTGSGQDEFSDTWAFRYGHLELRYVPQGTIQSLPFDTGPDFHSLNRITWYGEIPLGTSITLRFRSSQTNVNSSSFTDIGNGSRPVHQGRFVQWNATLHASSDRTKTPELGAVVLEYTVNSKPRAFAGEDRQAYKRTEVVLNGSAVDLDGDPVTYKWSRVSGPATALNNPESQRASFIPTNSGAYVFSLVVSDGFAESQPATVTITVPNRPPRCDAGPNQTGFKRELVTFTATASDEDGDPLSYLWTQSSGPPAMPAVTDQPFLSFVPFTIGCYTFRLEVSDGEETSEPSYVTAVISGKAPTAHLEARPSQTGLNSEVLFSASRSRDEDGDIVAWLFDFGDGNSSGWIKHSSVNHTYTAPGEYNATVRVRDDDGMESGCATARVRVENRPPVVDAQVYPLTGNTSTVFRFSVPAGTTIDPDGTIVAYEWDFGDGTTASGSAQTHTYRKKGNYTVVFTVTDNFGAKASVELEVRVLNRPPVVVSCSPAERTVCYTGVGQLFSVAMSDPDGDRLFYEWFVNDVPQRDNDSSMAFTPEKKGVYKILVRVSDGEEGVMYVWTLEVRSRPAIGQEGKVELFWPAIIIVLIIAATITIFFLRRGREAETEAILEAEPIESYEGPPPPEAEPAAPAGGEVEGYESGGAGLTPPPALPEERLSYAPDPYQQKLWSRRGPE